MTSETETVLDRRRMRRRLTTWRGIALAALALAIGAFAFSGAKMGSLSGEKQIARISITGTITEDRDQLRMLKKIAEAEHVAALLVYINSPGGTTTGGEALFGALREVAEKKPVVGQFGTVAASAGYITGLATDHIVARGNTITGSVGVLVQWPQVTELLDKIGVKVNTVRSGLLKARPSPVEETTPEALEVTEAMIQESFQWFLALVAERRKLDPDSVPGLKTGRIFSGRMAKDLKLVDEIGGEPEAIRYLETKRDVPADLEVVDWKPADDSGFGLFGANGGWVSALFGGAAEPITALLSRSGPLATLGLDGLVSVWHPSEN